MIEIKTKDFDLKSVLECGQCFRFYNEGDRYIVIAHNKVLRISQENDILKLDCTEEDYTNIWKIFFDIERDYSEIKERISEGDSVLQEAIKYAPNIRLLNQDPYECLISFIISQNSNIPRIKKVIENLSNKFGESIDGTHFSFPTSYALHQASQDEIMECKTGFRHKYIKDAVRRIETENFDLYNIKTLEESRAREELMRIYGVGEKVSDCVLLFSMEKYSSFPTDVWVKRIMQEFYFDGKEVKIPVILDFAREKWGDYAGFAQQYLFYYAIEKKIGRK